LESYHPYLLPQEVSKTPTTLGTYGSLSKIRKGRFGFLRPLGVKEHLFTMDTRIIQHGELRQAISQGLNHIPLKPTSLATCVATIMDAFDQLISILDLENHDF
jgi:hypothetical protein